MLGQLESRRDEKLTGRVVSLQAHCRGYLARKKLQQRRLQDLAVRCIQRNVRKFMSVRDWPWWRLLVRVTPLLNVHRTEEELRIKTVSGFIFKDFGSRRVMRGDGFKNRRRFPSVIKNTIGVS